MDLTLDCRTVEVDSTTSSSKHPLRATLLGVDESDLKRDASAILDAIELDDALDHFGVAEVLECIGKEEAMGHFGLEEPDE
jgi:hypothetical protein